MNNNETYYGKEKSSSISFLEYGSTDINTMPDGIKLDTV